LISIIGIRLFQLKLVGRSDRSGRASGRVPTAWLTALKLLRPKLAVSKITVYNYFREVAKLGGFLGRTGDGEPGWQTIWRGYRKIQSLLDAKRLLQGK
jgi:hypothetical protein